MKVLFLNQCFYPDVMASAQQLTHLAQGLVERGHQVTIIAGDRGYDDPATRFPRRETWQGITILCIPSLALGKQSKWRRAGKLRQLPDSLFVATASAAAV